MARSLGHQKWPDHKVEEKPLDQNMQVTVGGQVVADSKAVIEVDEDKYPARYYFPRSDTYMTLLERSDKTTQCPFKGTAQYFNLNVNSKTIENVAWSYEDPFDEHQALRSRIAFHDEKPDIEIRRY